MAINYNYETDFVLPEEDLHRNWVEEVVKSEDLLVNEVSFIFCDDEYLLGINQKFLRHDSYTDIITFDYTEGQYLSGDIFISVERVSDNAKNYNQENLVEMRRVMAHGLLHMMGYNDKSDIEEAVMREKELEKINMFHVEH